MNFQNNDQAEALIAKNGLLVRHLMDDVKANRAAAGTEARIDDLITGIEAAKAWQRQIPPDVVIEKPNPAASFSGPTRLTQSSEVPNTVLFDDGSVGLRHGASGGIRLL